MRIPHARLVVRDISDASEDKSFAVKIATWILLGTTLLMFLSRVAIKLSFRRLASPDDFFILLATVFAIALSVTSLIMASEGLGVLGPLTLSKANALQKAYYSSQFLYIASICFTKLCLVAFFYTIEIQRVQRRIVYGLGIFILAWSGVSLLAVAFQCGFPKPWEVLTLHCYNISLFWVVYCIIDMTTDVAIIMLSVNLVAYLKVAFSCKAMVVACFVPRILVMTSSLARLIYLYPINPHDNPAYALWVPVIISQIQGCLSITTACIPFLKPFFDMRRIDELRNRGTNSESRLLKGHRRAKSSQSYNSTTVTSFHPGRTLEKSPRLPSPAPLSPLTTPYLHTPSVSRSTSGRSPSDRGLRLQIPAPVVPMPTNFVSPQTASSFALSPQCLSPSTLLSPQLVSPMKSASSHISRPRQPVFFVADVQGGPSGAERANKQRLLSPVTSPDISTSPRSRTVRYSLTPQVRPTPPTILPKVVKPRRPGATYGFTSSVTSPDESIGQHLPARDNDHVFQAMAHAPKFSTAPRPSPISPTVTIPARHARTPTFQTALPQQRPMPPIYAGASPPNVSSSFTVSQDASSLYRARNQRILSPQNSSRAEHISPTSPASPPRTPYFSQRLNSSPESASAGTETPYSPMRANKPWETEDMPVIQDKRSAPRVVFQTPP